MVTIGGLTMVYGRYDKLVNGVSHKSTNFSNWLLFGDYDILWMEEMLHQLIGGKHPILGFQPSFFKHPQ